MSCPLCGTCCVCSRPGLVSVVCGRCGEAAAAQESAADTWARRHRCRLYKHVGWDAQMDAAVVEAAGTYGGLKQLAERRCIPYTAVQKRAEVLRKRGVVIPRPPRGRTWTAAEDTAIVEAVRLNHVEGFVQKDGGRLGVLAGRLGVPVGTLRNRSHAIRAKAQVLQELKKSGEGVVAPNAEPGPNSLPGREARTGPGR